MTLFACLCLKERFGLFEVANIFFTLLGVILVFKPPFLFGATGEDTSSVEQVDYLSYGIVVFATLFNAGSITGTRALKVLDFKHLFANRPELLVLSESGPISNLNVDWFYWHLPTIDLRFCKWDCQCPELDKCWPPHNDWPAQPCHPTLQHCGTQV